jgi:hypothetical protein
VGENEAASGGRRGRVQDAADGRVACHVDALDAHGSAIADATAGNM